MVQDYVVECSAMSCRTLRIAALLWLGWYASGPLCASFDGWGQPRQAVRDVARNAGGAVTLVAVVFYFAACFIRKWRERCSFPARILRGWLPPLSFYLPTFVVTARPASSHSPPVSPLRI